MRKIRRFGFVYLECWKFHGGASIMKMGMREGDFCMVYSVYGRVRRAEEEGELAGFRS